ncbi:MAG: hypothetical protein ACI4F5_07230 [Acutalibacteraceae bacterium]
MKKFESLTIFLLASNETQLLRQTVEIIEKSCNIDDICEIRIVLKGEKCPSCSEAWKLQSEHENINVCVQKSASIKGCFSELPPTAESSHFLIMASDMETDPNSVKEMIEISKENPDAIVCASKWAKGSVVSGYGVMHSFCSRTINKIAALIVGRNIRDPFSVFEIYPSDVFRRTEFPVPSKVWAEYSCRPLLAGEKYIEIPTRYSKRSEGKSNIRLLYLVTSAIEFIKTVILLRITYKRKNKRET